MEDLRGQELPQAQAGFAVAGTGLEALRAAYDVMVKKKEPRATFQPDEQITVVFFSEPVGGDRVGIRDVERQGNVIVIHYGLELYYTRNITAAFALISLGTLPPGKYDVKPELAAGERSKRGAEQIGKFICKPFSFEVLKK